MVGPPELRYAMNGPWRLADQVLGDGPDLMYLPGWVGNVEGNWLAPDDARFIERLASFGRTIVVDRRGNGCSDRLSPGETSTLEEGVEDLRLIARAAQSFRTALFGVQEGGFYPLLAAATHPERFTKLILFGGPTRGSEQTKRRGDGPTIRGRTPRRRSAVRAPPAWRRDTSGRRSLPTPATRWRRSA
ncbi:MAG TPA: alpha/beta hydrolase [Gemmatimonadota bacterium]|nr:alpha/beta hydrolase [Gemmatimonadota bacterium]